MIVVTKQKFLLSVYSFLAGALFASAFNAPRDVSGVVAGEETQSMLVRSARNPNEFVNRLETFHSSPLIRSQKEALQSLGISLYPEDQATFFPDPALGLGSQITILRATPVMIDNGGSRTYVRTFQTTVRGLLKERRIDVGVVDSVDPGLDEELWWGGRVIITRVESGQYVAVEDIGYDVETRDNPSMFVDETKVLREGKRGKKEVTVRFRRENGREVEREILSERILSRPTPKIVVRGTKFRPATGRWEDLINEIAPRYGADPAGLAKIMMCESGGNLTSYNPAGPYYGMFQFEEYTWTRIVGYPMSMIYDARAQIDGAAKLYSARYWHWPVCSRGT